MGDGENPSESIENRGRSNRQLPDSDPKKENLG